MERVGKTERQRVKVSEELIKQKERVEKDSQSSRVPSRKRKRRTDLPKNTD